MRVRTPLRIAALVLVAVVLLAFLAAFFIDEPLRRIVESNVNRRMVGYTAKIEKAHFHPIGCSLDVLDLVLAQDAHPDPSVMRIGQLHASVHWRKLLFGRAVADFRLYRPVLYVDHSRFEAELKDPTPIDKHGWQQALEAIYPLKMNRFEIAGGEVTYYDGGPTTPLRLWELELVAENIRNIHSPDRTYPSPVQATAILFDRGHLAIDGHADFLAEPHVGVKADVRIDGLPLAYVQPIVCHYNLDIRKGILATEGQLEYAPSIKTVDLKTVNIDGVDADYVRRAETAMKEEQTKTQAKEAVKAADNKPGLLIKADEVSGIGKLLKNHPRREVATVVDVSGPLGNTQTSTVQAILGLLRNAFVRAILPGFDRELTALTGRRRALRSGADGAAMVKPSRDPVAADGDTSRAPRSRR